MKQMLKLSLHLSFRVELSRNGLQDTYFLALKIHPDVKRLLRDHRIFLSHLDLKFPRYQSRKGNFVLYPCGKVIDFKNFELIIPNYQSKNSRIPLEM